MFKIAEEFIIISSQISKKENDFIIATVVIEILKSFSLSRKFILRVISVIVVADNVILVMSVANGVFILQQSFHLSHSLLISEFMRCSHVRYCQISHHIILTIQQSSH